MGYSNIAITAEDLPYDRFLSIMELGIRTAENYYRVPADRRMRMNYLLDTALVEYLRITNGGAPGADFTEN